MSENSPDLEDDTGIYESGLPGFLGTIDEIIAKVEAFMLAVGVILMAINTCVNVIARYVFGEGLFFSGEINRILIILITFAGIGYAARHGRHIRMSAIYDAIPVKGESADDHHRFVHLGGYVLPLLSLIRIYPDPVQPRPYSACAGF